MLNVMGGGTAGKALRVPGMPAKGSLPGRVHARPMAAPVTARPSVPPAQAPLRPPLGLPTGSVRATLALILSGSLWYAILQGIEPPAILIESALLVVAFYFGVRSTAPIVPATRTPTPAAPTAPEAATTPRVRQPLYVPRGVIRSILAAGFLGVIAYVAYRDGAIPQALVLILQVIASYAIGYAISFLLLRRARLGKELSRGARIARNAISLLVIGVTAGASWAIITGQFDAVPDYLQNGLAWTVAFYFGSRVSAA
jgi:hypothetical protein